MSESRKSGASFSSRWQEWVYLACTIALGTYFVMFRASLSTQAYFGTLVALFICSMLYSYRRNLRLRLEQAEKAKTPPPATTPPPAAPPSDS
jgi:hypothetical protein